MLYFLLILVLIVLIVLRKFLQNLLFLVLLVCHHAKYLIQYRDQVCLVAFVIMSLYLYLVVHQRCLQLYLLFGLLLVQLVLLGASNAADSNAVTSNFVNGSPVSSFILILKSSSVVALIASSGEPLILGEPSVPGALPYTPSPNDNSFRKYSGMNSFLCPAW